MIHSDEPPEDSRKGGQSLPISVICRPRVEPLPVCVLFDPPPLARTLGKGIPIKRLYAKLCSVKPRTGIKTSHVAKLLERSRAERPIIN